MKITLPQTLNDFKEKRASISQMRDYLLSRPVCEIFTVGEVRFLQDLNEDTEETEDMGLIQACFKKLSKVPLPKWEKLMGEK